MSMSLSAVSPSTTYAPPAFNPALDDVLAQSAQTSAQVAPEEVGSMDPAQLPALTDPALGTNLDISV
ncbi:MAG: hypothetical protein CGW95_15800 [Phenylobacterium zucineum]|nr:MAG: hypothetical protein CGW95_15800 [Phenylobacterium zucineum]